MQTQILRSTTQQSTAPAQDLAPLLSKVGNFSLSLVLVSGFVVTAKVLVAPFVAPVARIAPTQLDTVAASDRALVNCQPNAYQVCLD